MRSRRLPALWIALLALCVGGAQAAPPAAAEEINNREFNFQMDLPREWVKEPRKGFWEKDGIREGALRRLEKLDNGAPAQGEGGRMYVSVIDAPKGKTLAELGADPAQREFLLRDFGKPDVWPPVEVEESRVMSQEGEQIEVPALLLSTKGSAINLAETDASPCRGKMLMVLQGTKLYRVKLLAWTTPDDDEQLRSDLDAIEITFAFIEIKKEKPKEDPANRPGGPVAPGGPSGPSGPDGKPKEPEEAKPVGDSDEEKVIDESFVIEGWKAKKPKKLATQPIDKVKDPNIRVSLGNNDAHGACALLMYVYPNEGYDAAGNKLGLQDIRKQLTKSWWDQIASVFEKGALVTFDWPKRKGGDFVAMPLISPETEKVVFAEPKHRPKLEDVDIEAVLQMKGPWVEEVPKAMFGKLKCRDVYRGVIRGAAKTSGLTHVIRFGWRTPMYTYFIYIRIEREGLKRYAVPVKEFLDSLEVTK